MRKRLAFALFITITCVLGQVAYSADFTKGLDAAKKGDYANALKEWRPLADQGVAEAQYNLGLLYANGQGVPQDDREAVQWFRRAADQGQAKAQFNLGLRYAKGQGVAKDDAEAYMWFNLAAARGYKKAGTARDTLESMMTAQGIADAQRRSREWNSRLQP